MICPDCKRLLSISRYGGLVCLTYSCPQAGIRRLTAARTGNGRGKGK